MLKKLRYILFPLSLIYGAVIKIRNFLFDKNILHSIEFNIPVICVGNLVTGGTGKTPMAEYLIELLSPQFKTALLSRGYKRKTKGFIIANEKATTATIGDELMQVHSTYPGVVIAADSDRLTAIPHILQLVPDVEVVLMDDAFQYRRVKAGLNILLTSFNSLYVHDIFLPAGDLRDSRSGSKRADLIIVTKCDPGMTAEDRNVLIEAIGPSGDQKVFFTSLAYQRPGHLFTKENDIPDKGTSVLLVTGIANPNPLLDKTREMARHVKPLFFRDHHDFTEHDILHIRKEFEILAPPEQKKMIITTRKDGMRLLVHRNLIEDLPIYVYPVKHAFLFGEEDKFNQLIIRFIKNGKLN